MLSFKSRFSVVAVIVLALALHVVCVSSLSAGPLSTAASHSGDALSDWLAAALHWLDRALTASRPAKHSAAGVSVPDTGSCIDPHGIQTWCS